MSCGLGVRSALGVLLFCLLAHTVLQWSNACQLKERKISDNIKDAVYAGKVKYMQAA